MKRRPVRQRPKALVAIARNCAYIAGAIVACDGTTGFGPLFLFSLPQLHRHVAGGYFIAGKEFIMPVGTVKFFNTDKGYGFIAPEDGGSDSFVHISAVQAAGMQTLNKDQKVSYEIETDRRGKQSAVNLQHA